MNKDLYQSLYEQQDYETLVKQTASLSNLNMIRYHLIGLLGLGANQLILKIMVLKFTMIQQALSIFLKIHYEILKENRDFPEHALLIERYQSLPYLNQEVEAMVSQIKILFQKPPTTKPMDLYQLFLDAAEKQDHGLLMDLVPQLKPIHLFSAKATIKQLLVSMVPQRIKGMLVIALIDAKYDEVIVITKGDQSLSFNPIDTINPFADGTFEKYQSEIDALSKDPSIRQIAYSLLSTYMLAMVPFDIDPEYYFFSALISLAYTYLKLDPPLSYFNEEETKTILSKRMHLEAVLKM